MRYLFLLYDIEANRTGAETPEEVEAMLAPWHAYGEALREAGVYVGGDALQTTATSTTLRQGEGGEVVVTDGPFAETTEQLGGFYMVDVPDLDEAMRWARRCPILDHGTLEIRPIETFGAE